MAILADLRPGSGYDYPHPPKRTGVRLVKTKFVLSRRGPLETAGAESPFFIGTTAKSITANLKLSTCPAATGTRTLYADNGGIN